MSVLFDPLTLSVVCVAVIGIYTYISSRRG